MSQAATRRPAWILPTWVRAGRYWQAFRCLSTTFATGSVACELPGASVGDDPPDGADDDVLRCRGVDLSRRRDEPSSYPLIANARARICNKVQTPCTPRLPYFLQRAEAALEVLLICCEQMLFTDSQDYMLIIRAYTIIQRSLGLGPTRIRGDNSVRALTRHGSRQAPTAAAGQAWHRRRRQGPAHWTSAATPTREGCRRRLRQATAGRSG